MMQIFILILLAGAQWLLGFAVLSLFRSRVNGWVSVSASMLLGMGIYSFLPLFMELLRIPLTGGNIAGAITVVTGGLIALKAKRFMPALKELGSSLSLRIKLFEIPFALILGLMIFVSAWRCFYYPPTPRDLTSGPEVIAEYAVQEKTMINSVFTVNLGINNNPFKPAYLASLQIIYKYAGFPFGQVWLIPMFAGFVIFLYHALALRLHKIIVGSLLVCFVAIPEMYAYTIMALFDYSNMVFLTLTFFFLIRAFEKLEEPGNITLAALLGGIATYDRSETLILIGFTALFLLFLYPLIGKKKAFLPASLSAAGFILPSVVAYLISMPIYMKYYLPVSYAVEGQVTKNPGDLSPFFQRLSDINSELLFGEGATMMFGYVLYIFIFFFLADLVFFRKVSAGARPWVIASLIVYLGLPFMGYLLPLMDLNNTTKRGLFKLFPLLLFALSYNGVLLRVTGGLRKLEYS